MSLLPPVSGLGRLGALATILVAVCAFVAPPIVPLVSVIAALIVVLSLWAPPPARTSDAGEANAESDGEYEILDKIGEGGMGEVYRARQTELGRLVALKRIKDESLTEEDRMRFKREARTLSGLFSPHTINVFDAGIQSDESLFYVMELLDGVNLRELVEKHGAIEPRRVIHILRQAALSLAEAHSQGLVHRDIKPANLMVCRYGGEYDFVKVLDFGLVKGGKVDVQGDQEAITHAGALPGTPAFLAPEAVSGPAYVDARTDLYSLGAIGHYLLTARHLFEADSPLAMVRAQVHERPSLASESSPFALPRELDLLIDRCLHKEPSERPQSAEEMFVELEKLSVAHPWTRADAAACWDAIPVPSTRPTHEALPSDKGRR